MINDLNICSRQNMVRCQNEVEKWAINHFVFRSQNKTLWFNGIKSNTMYFCKTAGTDIQ